MANRLQALFIGMLLIGLAPLTGCEAFSQVVLEIPDYTSSNVSGITIWSQDPGTGEYLPASVYKLGQIIEVDGQEYVEYRVVDDRVKVKVKLTAMVNRDPEDPDSLIVVLPVLTNGSQMIVRASTYNDVGDSELSSNAADLAT